MKFLFFIRGFNLAWCYALILLLGLLNCCTTNNSENNAIGECLYFKFDTSITVEKIKYVPGGLYSGKQSRANARLKTFSFELKSSLILDKYFLEDEPGAVIINLKKPLSSTEFKLIVNDIYKGDTSNVLLINELSFFDGKNWFNVFSSMSNHRREFPGISFFPAFAADSALIDITFLPQDFVFHIKYATIDNFLNEQLYDCAKCLLRKQVAMALLQARDLFSKDGYRIKIFDCYRPVSIQKKMWEKIKDERYVANPSTKFASAHNRGMAVDITLINARGKELNMGTKFDFFGLKAHHNFKNLSRKVLKNRKYLKKTMEKAGFQAISSEWWHYSYKHKQFNISDIDFKCN